MNKTIHSQQSERVREALVKLRQNARLTQRQLAKKLRREHSLISRLELGERRVDVVEFFWICQACGADPARTASSLMRQFAKMQAESPGSQGEPGNAEGRMQNEESGRSHHTGNAEGRMQNEESGRSHPHATSVRHQSHLNACC